MSIILVVEIYTTIAHPKPTAYPNNDFITTLTNASDFPTYNANNRNDVETGTLILVNNNKNTGDATCN